MSPRFATPADVDQIHELVCALADYEKLRHAVVSTPRDFDRALFGETPLLEALVMDTPAPIGSGQAHQLVGMALFYPTFSTFAGRPGLWLEDVYVRPEYRHQGIGKAFMEQFLRIAQERNCARAEWSVLDWNSPAIEFYRHLGADLLPEWRIARVELPSTAANP